MKKLKFHILITLIFILTFPTNVLADTPPNSPDLIAKSAISIDLDTNEIIYTQNINLKSFPASLTKLMTGLLLAENNDKTDTLAYTKSAKEQDPYTYNYNIHPVKIGDEMTADMVMDSLLLFSANDIAYMVADNVSGDAKNFSIKMNEKAKQLGMKNTNFVTANGLDDYTDDHYTTAYDLTKLVKAVYLNPWMIESMNKETSVVNFINGPKATLTNRNKILGIDGNIGGKTGFTDKAGRCFIAIYERDGRHIAGIVLNSEYNYPEDTKVFEDMEKLIDWSYEAKKDTLIKKNTVLETATLTYIPLPFWKEKEVEIDLEVREDITYYNNDIKIKQSLQIDELDIEKLDSNTSFGTLTVTQGESSKSYNLYPTITKEDLKQQDKPLYITAYALVAFLIILVLIILIFLIKTFKKRSNYNSKNKIKFGKNRNMRF